MRLTFKKDKRETGLRAVGNGNPDVNIKADGEIVGLINGPTWQTKDGKFSISLVVDKEIVPNDPAGFQWVTLKARFDAETEARDFVKRNWETIQSKYALHRMGDWKQEN